LQVGELADHVQALSSRVTQEAAVVQLTLSVSQAFPG